MQNSSGFFFQLPHNCIPIAQLPAALREAKQAWLSCVSVAAIFSSDVEDGDLVRPMSESAEALPDNVAAWKDAVWVPVKRLLNAEENTFDSTIPAFWGIAFKQAGRILFGPTVQHSSFGWHTGDVLYADKRGKLTTTNTGILVGFCVAPGTIYIGSSASESEISIQGMQEKIGALDSFTLGLEAKVTALGLRDEELASFIAENVRQINMLWNREILEAPDVPRIAYTLEEVEEAPQDGMYLVPGMGSPSTEDADISNRQTIADGTTVPRSLGSRFADVINVKDFGAKGDGVTDDTAAIQAALDVGGGKLVVFPDGVYIVTEPLITSASNAQKVFIDLGSATIKASDDFVGEWVLILGGKGAPTEYKYTTHINGIRGGKINANGRCSGILSMGTHLARIQDINIFGITNVGVQIDPSNNSSADAYVQNVNVAGTNVLGSIGLYANSHDNDVENFRSRDCYIGVRALKGGYFSNCHPIFGLMDENYDTSVGFDIVGATLDNCYSDNFSTAFQNSSNSLLWKGFSLIAYWYTNTSHNHTVIRNTNSPFLLCAIEGLRVEMPSNGVNRGIWTTVGYVAPYAWSTYNAQKITGLRISEDAWQNFSNKYADALFQSSVLGENTQYLRNEDQAAAVVSVGKWYPLIVLPSNSSADPVHLQVRFANDVSFELVLKPGNTTFSVVSVHQVWNTANASLKFAAVRQTTQDNVAFWVVYYNVLSTNSNINESAVTLESVSLKNFFYMLPRAIHQHDGNYDGLDALEGAIESPMQLLAHGTPRPTESCLLAKWVKEWSIPLHPGKDLDHMTIDIAYGNHNALYVYFSGRVVRYFSTGSTETVTYDETTKSIHITTPSTGIVHVLYG